MKLLIYIVISIAVLPTDLLAQTCCVRLIASFPLEVPAGESPNIAKDGFESVFHTRPDGGGPLLNDCPLNLQFMGSNYPDIEYLFKGKINKTPGADQYTMRMELIDIAHGQVVKQGQISWKGTYGEGLGFSPDWDYIKKPRYNWIRSLAHTFQPLDDLIHEYERLPELCDVQPEKESIEAGQTMTIEISDIVDSRTADPQLWQRILVRADKGKVLNGYDKGDWHVFETGSGSVTVQYKAPQVCEDEQEEIQVWNSCNCTGSLFNTSPEKEIGRTHFNIYDRKPEKLTILPEPIKVKVGNSITIRLTDIVDGEGKPLEPNEQVMVSVDEGRITNGMPLGTYKVFDVVKGKVNVNYQAPNDLSVNMAGIKIYNLCVKGDELVEVVPHRLIAQKTIIIEFPPLTARITRIVEKTRDTHIDKTEWGDLRKVKKGNSHSTQRVSIIASFSDDPGTGFLTHRFQMMSTKVHYRMIDCQVVSETYTYKGEYYSANYDAQGLTKEGTTKTVRNGRAVRIDPPCEKNSISLKTETSQGTTKVNYVSVPFFDVEFLVDEHVEYKGKKEGTDRQLVPNDYSSSRSFTSKFAVQPTVVKDKDACFKVTGGDGVHFMSGGCAEIFPQPGKDVDRTTREVYEWQVYRR
jgi:hypothetical protein